MSCLIQPGSFLPQLWLRWRSSELTQRSSPMNSLFKLQTSFWFIKKSVTAGTKGNGCGMAKEAGFPWSALKKSRVVPRSTRTWNGWDAYWDLKPTCSRVLLLHPARQDLHRRLAAGMAAHTQRSQGDVGHQRKEPSDRALIFTYSSYHFAFWELWTETWLNQQQILTSFLGTVSKPVCNLSENSQACNWERPACPAQTQGQASQEVIGSLTRASQAGSSCRAGRGARSGASRGAPGLRHSHSGSSDLFSSSCCSVKGFLKARKRYPTPQNRQCWLAHFKIHFSRGILKYNCWKWVYFVPVFLVFN